MGRKWEHYLKFLTKCCTLIAVLATLLFFNSVHAQAATAKTKALNAYNKLLSQKTLKWSDKVTVSTSKCKFAVIYVDNNSVPELFVDGSSASLNHATGFYKLYTYYNGKVKDVCTIRDGFSYYKKKGVFVTAAVLHGEYLSYYKLASGKASLKLRSDTYYTTTYYDGAGKKISKTTFDNRLKSLKGSLKPTSMTCKKNTKANRTKYLK